MSSSLKIILREDFKKEEFYCSLCKYPYITNDDFDCCEKSGVCNDCFLAFVECDIEAWKNGIRPEKRKVDDYLLLRKNINSRKEKL